MPESIKDLTQSQSVENWLNMLPEEFREEALKKMPPKCAGMMRNNIFDAILCARSYRESIEVYNDTEDWWMQLHDTIKQGDY